MLGRRVVRFMRLFIILLLIFIPITTCFWFTNTVHDSNNDTSVLKLMDFGMVEESRKKKKKKDRYFSGLILGAILVKMILFPLAVKAMAVMSTVSVILSTMSLILASIIGYAKLAAYKPHHPLVRYVHVNDMWAKGDDEPTDYIPPDSVEYIPNVPLEQIHHTMK